jgi:GNAT superfamily N-acetyltransferase
MHLMAFDLDVVAFREEFLPQAAALWVEKFHQQRQAVPILPDQMLDAQRVAEKVSGFCQDATLWAVLHQGRLVGYLGAYLVDAFRNTANRAAYVPVWGHAALGEHAAAVYRALYRPASAFWRQAGCKVHAITLLAADAAAREAWFWNGFGLAVVDAIRPIAPLGVLPASGVEVRQARVEDAQAIALLEIEHVSHYRQPPVLMIPSEPNTAQQYVEFMGEAENSVWLAVRDGEPVGYQRFERSTFGATDIVQSDSTIVNSGAYLRPQARGLGAGPAMLDAALRYYAARGYQRCSVDFESFNPEAAYFWTKHFTPVCLSLLRHPELEPEG